MSALTGFRVVELADSVAAEYCGKLLADFGAEVIKIEAPDSASGNRARSALFAYLNTNKQSATLAGVPLRQLIGGADAVIEDRPSSWAAQHPSVVFCSVTPFGQGAPPEFDNAKSINVFHASGWGYHTPSHANPAEPPLQGPGHYLADYEAGLDAALCVASALFGRLHTGQGEAIDVSQQAALVSRADCILGRFIAGDITPDGVRGDYDQQGPATFFGCADGFVYLYMTNRAHWLGVKSLMGNPRWLDTFDDDWLEFAVTREKVAEFQRGFAEWVRDIGKNTAAEQAQRLGVPLVPVNEAADLIDLPQYRHRRFFHEVNGVAYPTVPYLMSVTPAEIRSPAPTLGQHTAEVRISRPTPVLKRTRIKRPRHSRGGPLAGVRVVELTKVWAGPYAGKLLALLGADVIKVESAALPEEMRAYGGTDINHAPFFLSINPEILSVDLDIKSSDGMTRLRELIAHSDIVINNLRPGAMERQGLGYDDLKAMKPDIISVSIKMWGNDGPSGQQTGYAPCFAALAGLASLVGYPGGPPRGASMRYGDSTVGAAAAFGAVVALLHRELSGEGQFVDVSAVETLTSMIGDRLLAHNLTGVRLGTNGNDHPDLFPHGCYPCLSDGWIAVAVTDDAEWRQLCRVLDAAWLVERFPTIDDRRAHRVALDAELAALTKDFDAEQLAQRLRVAGVAANKSATAIDVISDQRLWDRELYRFVSDHREGQRPILGASWRMARNPTRIERGAPDLGEHNDYVLREILGGSGTEARS